MNTPVYGQKLKDNGAYFQTLKVTASIIPDMRVNISEGSAFINRKLVEYVGGSGIGPLAVPTVSSYIAVVGLKGNNAVILYGDIADNNPSLPEIPSDVLPLAAIVLRAADTVITSDMIQDIRPLFSATTFIESHTDLKDTDTKNSHPISAITDLQEELDKKLDVDALGDQLATKANNTGTSATTFTLNANSQGVPTTDVVLEFKRGAMGSAAIRFNEETDHLEFTDDGNTWSPLDTTLKLDPWNQENYYTKAQVDNKVGTIETALANKAEEDEVAALKKATADMATKTYVNNQFLNLYSKQDLDSIVAQMKQGLLTINSKAESTDVYSKTESDDIIANTKAELNDSIDAVNTKVDSLQEKVDTIDPKFEAMGNSVDAQLADTRNQVKEELDSTLVTITAETERLNKRVDDGLADVDQRINSAAATSITVIAETTGRLDAKFDNAIRDINDKYGNIEESFETAKNETTEKIDAFDEKLTVLDTTVNNNVEAISTAEENIQNINGNIDTINSNIDEVKSDIDAIKTADTKQDERIEALENTVQENKELADQALADATETINETINSKEETVNEAIEAVNSSLTEAVDVINEAINSKEETVNETINNVKEELELKNAEIEESISTLSDTVNDKEDALITRIVNAKSELQNNIDTINDNLNSAISEASTTVTNVFTAADQNIVDDINAKLELKADKETAATKLELEEAIENIDITDSVYTKSEIDDMVSGKANISDVYQYTQAQIDNTLSNKQEALGYTPEDSANKNQVNGYAGLDANGKISINQLPDSARQKTYVIANATERTALTGLIQGDRAFETSTGDSYIYNGSNWTLVAAANWENVNIQFNNIIGKPNTLSGYGITDGITEASVDTKLEGKAAKDHTHIAAEVETSDERMFISKAQLESIDAKANGADVYSKNVADLTFVKKDELTDTLSEYAKSDAVVNTIDAKITEAEENYYDSDKVDELLANKVDADDATIAHVTDVDQKISDAKDELTTEINKKANSTDVYAKADTYSQAEIDDAIDASIDSALQSVNNAINEALGNNSGSGSVNSIEETIASTKSLIKQLSKDKDDKITAVEEKIIEKVVTKENIINIVKDETDIDLTGLAKSTDVTNEINNALAPVNTNIDTLTATVNTKVSNDTFTTLSDKVDSIDSEVTTVKASAKATADSLAEYIPVIGSKTTMAEVETKLADYTNTVDLKALLDAKATPEDINSALENYTTTIALNTELAAKATPEDISTALEAYTNTEDLNTALAEKANKAALLTSNDVLYNKVMVRNKTGYENSYTLIFNELNSGGGSQVYNSSDNTLSYIGTNLSSTGDKVQVQIYAKHKDTNIGTRLNVNTDLGMFYLKGTTNADPWNADREVAVLADIKVLKSELESKIQELQDAIDALDVTQLSADVADLQERVTILENI